MKYIASCSGGKDSVATLILAKAHGEPLDEVVWSEVMFSEEISGEFPEHRNFVYEVLKPFVENTIGVPFVIVRAKKTYVDFFRGEITRGANKGKPHGFPIPGMCTINRDCKIPPIKEYWKSIGDEVTQYVGIAADEPKRLKRLKDNQVSLLEKYGYTEAMAYDLCERHGLLSPIYKIASRNGCWFCFNNSDEQWRYLRDNHGELIDYLVELQNTTPIRARECLTRTETPTELLARLSTTEGGKDV